MQHHRSPQVCWWQPLLKTYHPLTIPSITHRQQCNQDYNKTSLMRIFRNTDTLCTDTLDLYGYPLYGYPLYGYPLYRYPLYRYPLYGYPLYGYPLYRYPLYGYPLYGYPLYRYPLYGYPLYRYPLHGYPLYRYPLYGYPLYGYPLTRALWNMDTSLIRKLSRHSPNLFNLDTLSDMSHTIDCAPSLPHQIVTGIHSSFFSLHHALHLLFY